MSPLGRAAKFALSGPIFSEFLEAQSSYALGGYPARRRRVINDVPVSLNDARVIRRWKAGTEVTRLAATRVLNDHGLDFSDLMVWAARQNRKPLLRGTL